MQPAVRFQTSALLEHCSGQKHQDSIAAEMIKRTSIFQEQERYLHRHEILYSAFMLLYWQVQHGIAYQNFSSMLKMMQTIGLEKLEHFQHESQCDDGQTDERKDHKRWKRSKALWPQW